MPTKGQFITLYGVNNTGKSTQAQLLGQRIRAEYGRRCQVIKYPIYSLEPSGPMLDDYLRNGAKRWRVKPEEVQAIYTLNRLHYEPQLKYLLNRGDCVIAEDYRFTGVAWGMVFGDEQHKLEKLNSCLLAEDLAILLSGPPLRRNLEQQHQHESNAAALTKAVAIFQRLASQYQWPVVAADPGCETAAQSIAAVHEALWTVVKRSGCL